MQRFYWFGPSSSKNPPGLIFENEEKLCLPGMRVFGTGDVRVRGFPPLVEPPRFRYYRKEGRKPLDLEPQFAYWLVTDKTRNVFEAVDPDAFAFAACRTIIDGQEALGDFWLCDVVRVLDALDEEKTKPIINQNGRKTYRFIGFEDVFFREEVVGDSHAFRMMHSWGNVICDETLRLACKAAGLKSLSFQRAAPNPYSKYAAKMKP